MRIDKKLNFIVPAETASGEVFVHATPISRDVFERYVFEISKTLSDLYSAGLTLFAGPRVAATMLKNIAIDRGTWEGPSGVEKGLMNEIRRLSNVVTPSEKGWETIPYYDAVTSGLIDGDAVAEVESALVFFICVSALHKRKEVPSLLDGIGEVWDTQTSSLNSTEWAASLPISTPAANTGATETLSSIPH